MFSLERDVQFFLPHAAAGVQLTRSHASNRLLGTGGGGPGPLIGQAPGVRLSAKLIQFEDQGFSTKEYEKEGGGAWHEHTKMSVIPGPSELIRP